MTSTNSPLEFLAAFAIVLVAGTIIGIGLAWGRIGTAINSADDAHV